MIIFTIALLTTKKFYVWIIGAMQGSLFIFHHILVIIKAI